jgi:hypothetical protein
MDSVVFDVSEFRVLYPQFSETAEETLELYFRAACLLLDNTKNSLVQDIDERKLLLYMLVCHIATLKQNGDILVGAVTSAAQGSVNVSVTPLNNANWYTQTQCGAMFWAATAKYRMGMRYRAYHRR